MVSASSSGVRVLAGGKPSSSASLGTTGRTSLFSRRRSALEKNLFGWFVSHELSPVQDEDTVGVQELFEVVGYVQDCLLGPQILEVLQNLPASRGVEHRGGFVEDEYLGFDGQEAGQCDALLLAARERMGLAAFVTFEADGPYGPGDPITHLLSGNAQVLQSECYVILDERGDEAVLRVLEEDAQVFADFEGFRCRIAA